MDLAAVMDEVGTRLATISGLRVSSSPPAALSPPVAWVEWPERIDYDATYGRGMDSMKLAVHVVVGRPIDRHTRDALAAYCKGSGSGSVKAAVESGTPAAYQTVRVASVEIQVVAVAAVDYLAASFVLEINGSGS